MAGRWDDFSESAREYLRSQGFNESNFGDFFQPYSSGIRFNESGMGATSIPLDQVDGIDRQNIGHYWNSVKDFLDGDDPTGSQVSSYSGYQVAGRYFETDLDVIMRQAMNGDLNFQSIYEI